MLGRFLSEVSRINRWSPPISPATNTSEFVTSLRAALAALPPTVKKAAERKLLGIFPVHHVGSSAITYDLFDNDLRPQGAFVLLDVNYLGRPANEWATAKELSPYQGSGRWSVQVELADAKSNTRLEALQFIVLHELGHVIGIGTGMVPGFGTLPDVDKVKDYAFLKLSWTVDGRRFHSLVEKDFPVFRNFKFYAKPGDQSSRDTIPGIYAALAQTSFVSAYASTDPQDDFAETLAIYVWTQLLKKPYRVQILDGNKVERSFSPDWSRPELQAKRKLIESLLL